MGNLRQKYTDEEWEDLGKQYAKEVKTSLRNKLDEENEWMNASLGIPSLDNTLNDIYLITRYQKIEELVKSTPNDQELGAKIRSLINS